MRVRVGVRARVRVRVGVGVGVRVGVVHLEACGGDPRRDATAQLRPLAPLALARHRVGGGEVGVEEGEGGRGVDIREAHGG